MRSSSHGLMPIIEPEISIKSPDKAGCETLLREDAARPARRPAEGDR